MIRIDLKRHSNTKDMVRKAYKKFWMWKRLQQLGASTRDMLEVFQYKSEAWGETVIPMWLGGLTKIEKNNIEKVKNVFRTLFLEINMGHMKQH